MIGKYKNKKDLIFALSYYIGGSIFGPLVFFGIGGYILDKHYETKPMYIIIGLVIAFIITNILIFRKAQKASELIIGDDDGITHQEEKDKL